MKAILIVMAGIFLASCSTYSRRDCQEMDYYLEGKKAALDGFTLKQGKTHLIDKCGENKGVSVDFVDFERGFTSGLNKLCTPEGRRALADRDIKYQGTCENHADAQEQTKTRTMELEEKVQSLQAEVARLKSENAKLSAECPAQ